MVIRVAPSEDACEQMTWLPPEATSAGMFHKTSSTTPAAMVTPPRRNKILPMFLLTLKGSMGNRVRPLPEGGARSCTTTLADAPECNILCKSDGMD